MHGAVAGEARLAWRRAPAASPRRRAAGSPRRRGWRRCRRRGGPRRSPTARRRRPGQVPRRGLDVALAAGRRAPLRSDSRQLRQHRGASATGSGDSGRTRSRTQARSASIRWCGCAVKRELLQRAPAQAPEERDVRRAGPWRETARRPRRGRSRRRSAPAGGRSRRRCGSRGATPRRPPHQSPGAVLPDAHHADDARVVAQAPQAHDRDGRRRRSRRGRRPRTARCSSQKIARRRREVGVALARRHGPRAGKVVVMRCGVATLRSRRSPRRRTAPSRRRTCRSRPSSSADVTPDARDSAPDPPVEAVHHRRGRRRAGRPAACRRSARTAPGTGRPPSPSSVARHRRRALSGRSPRPGDEVRADLAAPEDVDGRRERLEVAPTGTSALPGMTAARTSGSTASRCMPSVSTPAAFSRANQAKSSGGSHCTWMGSAGTARLHRRRAGGQVGGAAIGRRGVSRWSAPAARRRRGAPPPPRPRPAAPASCAPACGPPSATARSRRTGRRVRGVVVADARLHHRRGQHVARVQQRDLRVRDAVGGRERVEARRRRQVAPRPAAIVAQQHGAAGRRRRARRRRRRPAAGTASARRPCIGTITVVPPSDSARWSDGPAPPAAARHRPGRGLDSGASPRACRSASSALVRVGRVHASTERVSGAGQLAGCARSRRALGRAIDEQPQQLGPA